MSKQESTVSMDFLRHPAGAGLRGPSQQQAFQDTIMAGHENLDLLQSIFAAGVPTNLALGKACNRLTPTQGK